jgi:hypothetical protein
LAITYSVACFFGVKTQPFTHCLCSEQAEKTPQHFNASLFVNIWVLSLVLFLTIDARMGRVMKRGVIQNTGPCVQAYYSSLGPAAG